MMFIDSANLHRGECYFSEIKGEKIKIDLISLRKKIGSNGRVVATYYFRGESFHPNAVKFKKFLVKNGINVIEYPIQCDKNGIIKEKEVDVGLATKLLVKGFKHKYDVGVIVSGDRDFVPAIIEIRKIGLKIEIVSFKDLLADRLAKYSNKIHLIDNFYKEVKL